MSGNLLLELKNVSKRFRDNNGVSFSALENVDIHLERNQSIGIVGESGCGKSTLAKIISRLIEVSGGSIYFNNEDITSIKGKELRRYYRKVQMIFQDPLATFSARMKVGDYLIEPFINFKIMNKKEAYKYAGDLLEMVGLEKSFLKRYSNQLSGGQLQRVVIARAIGLKPEIIICDECTSALDASIQKQILDLLQKLKKKLQFSTVFITHDLALAENMCDRVYVIYEGRVVEVLKERNFFQEAKDDYTRVLLNSIFSLEKVKKNFVPKE